MLRKIFVILLISIFCRNNLLFSQNINSFCETTDNLCFFDTIPLGNRVPVDESNNYVFRIFVHLIKETAGSGGLSYEDLVTTLDDFTNDYYPFGICFSLLGTDEIRNSQIYNSDAWNDQDNDGNSDILQYCNPNAINIFLWGHNRLNYAQASGIGIGTTVVIGGIKTHNFIEYNLTCGKVLSHEIGHILGLYHTYRGCVVEKDIPEPGEGDICLETGPSNCETCGDYVCDTPPDIVTRSASVSINDCYASWLPDGSSSVCIQDQWSFINHELHITNIMSCTPIPCLQNLTLGQIERIKLLIASYFFHDIIIEDYFDDIIYIDNDEIYPPGSDLFKDGINCTFIVYNVLLNIGGKLTLRTDKEIQITETIVENGELFADASPYCLSDGSSINMLKKTNNNNDTNLNEFIQQNNILSDFKISIYPNPSNKYINIQYDLKNFYAVSISIYDYTGNLVRDLLMNVLQPVGNYSYQYNFSKNQSGLYFIKLKYFDIKSNNYKLFTYKIIKQ